MSLFPVITKEFFKKNYIDCIVSRILLPYHPKLLFVSESSKAMLLAGTILHVEMFYARVQCRGYSCEKKRGVCLRAPTLLTLHLQTAPSYSHWQNSAKSLLFIETSLKGTSKFSLPWKE